MSSASRALLLVFLAAANAAAAGPLPKAVRFNRDIRPLFSDRCYKCHGPDSTQRKANLRLDTKAGLFAKRGDVTAVVPGKTDASELLRRITSGDKDVKMPPPTSGRKLSKAEIALFRRWIAQGAHWEPHWALIPPTKPKVPSVRNGKRVLNPIDNFVIVRLEREGLSLSPEAKRTTLIRRVTLDLTGLPPTLKEVDDFLADNSPNAYEKVVDRLLKSRRYGEKMAVHWLDAARYADTSGYQNDGPRSMYRWRDWVIYAFVFNKPYNEFVLEQLAGDMLPHPTLDQKIATAFNRNHRGNAEGGIIPEEFQVEYVVDRVDTAFTVFQGLTIGCARCHDHKFDPISQKDFYRSFAFFNNIPENGRAIKEGNSPPYIKAPTRSQQRILAGFDRQLAAAKIRFRELQPDVARGATRVGEGVHRESNRLDDRCGSRRELSVGRECREPCETGQREAETGRDPIHVRTIRSRGCVGWIKFRRRRERRRLRLLRQVLARRLDIPHRQTRRNLRLADDRRRPGGRLRAGPQERQIAVQPRQTLARRFHPRRNEASHRARISGPTSSPPTTAAGLRKDVASTSTGNRRN